MPRDVAQANGEQWDPPLRLQRLSGTASKFERERARPPKQKPRYLNTEAEEATNKQPNNHAATQQPDKHQGTRRNMASRYFDVDDEADIRRPRASPGRILTTRVFTKRTRDVPGQSTEFVRCRASKSSPSSQARFPSPGAFRRLPEVCTQSS